MIDRPIYYRLDKNKNVIPCSSLNELKVINPKDNIIRHTNLGNILISTVFLVIDYSLLPIECDPILFETMIFMHGENDPDDLDQYQERYTNYKSALRGHRMAVKMVIKSLRNDNS
jgi:hypothetical protein